MLEKYRIEIHQTLYPEQTCYLATCLDGQPHVRPMTLIFSHEQFFLATGTNDAKTSQIAINPKVEICIPLKSENYSGYIRAKATLETVTNPKIRKIIFNESSFISKFWDSPEDEGFTLYLMHWQKVEYLKPGEQYPHYITWVEDRFTF